jgi:hypothetical protein
MQIRSGVGDDRLAGEYLQAIDVGQVHTGQEMQVAAQHEGGFIWRDGHNCLNSHEHVLDSVVIPVLLGRKGPPGS